jgi:hypothetical protein
VHVGKSKPLNPKPDFEKRIPKMTPLTSPISASPPHVKPFNLPMMAVFSIANHSDKSIAHALDFDLVSVASTEEEAIAKLRTAVKHHIEFGLRNNLERDIIFPAPQRFWDALTPHEKLSIGEPIEIDSCKMPTALRTVTDEKETELSLSAA